MILGEAKKGRRDPISRGIFVNQELNVPNQVIVYHQANDVDTLRRFVESSALKETMQRAGVIGAPDIRFVQSVDIAEY